MSKVIGAPPQTLLGSLQDPLACCPLFEEPLPHSQFVAKPMGSVSNQNCCKTFRFKEKVEKTHWCIPLQYIRPHTYNTFYII